MSLKHTPQTLWDKGQLCLAKKLCDIYTDFLNEKGWLKNYQPKTSGDIGGASSAQAQDHVTNRFLNSAARMQYVCIDVNNEQPKSRMMVLDQLAQGEIFILDLAAGHGAGTLSILSTICELRDQKIIPTLPLNVNIRGIDMSPDALNYYAEILEKLKPWLATNAIYTKLTFSVCDMNISGQINEVLDDFFEEAKAKKSNRFLCTISAVSGIKKEGVERMMDSLKLIAARLSHKQKSSSWLWVEPKLEKSWLGTFVESISFTLKQIFSGSSSSSDSEEDISKAPTRNFQWIDPINDHVTNSRVVVMQFKNL
ncbi:hypothetical protein [Polaromonas sp.]|uniref:hypothetical protein n=1 Tax=Polaromonas sp. TaxID=1869339 RepID=UPI0013BC4DCE|nr:hypothetical protein [Polaromonas sp.]NDP62411.1 hypothetical protein [Polaromonas sp.]